MSTFKPQRRMLKIVGLMQNPPKQTKYWLRCIILYNFLLCFLIMFGGINFASKLDDLLVISETIAPTITTLNAFVRYTVLWINSEELFLIMEEIEILNLEC